MDPILGRLINVAGSFLVLSLIVEKIADFWKLHKAGIRVPLFKPSDEKDREKRILQRNILVGIVLAIFMKADAIQMFLSGEPSEVMGWDNLFFYDPAKVMELSNLNCTYFQALRFDGVGFLQGMFRWAEMILGVALTGIALSFGSKLWHDLVGVLYAVKQGKTNIAERTKADTLAIEKGR